jgi:hypothetical protein
MRTIVLTPAQQIVSDYLLNNMQIGRIYNGLTGRMDGVTIGVNDKYPHLADEIISIVQGRDRDIINFLLQEKYISIENSQLPSYRLTEKGQTANEEGGHVGYLKWIDSESVAKAKKEKQNFFLSPLFMFVILPILLVSVTIYFTVFYHGSSTTGETKAPRKDTIEMH